MPYIEMDARHLIGEAQLTRFIQDGFPRLERAFPRARRSDDSRIQDRQELYTYGRTVVL